MAYSVTLTPAYGVLTFTGNLADGDGIKVGNITYRFKSTIAQANDVHLESTEALTLATFLKCINGTGVSGTDYYAGSSFNTDLVCVLFSTHVLRIYSKVPGALGNALNLSEVTDTGTILAVTQFANGVGDIAGTAGAMQDIFNLNEVQSELFVALKRFTYASD